MTKRKRKRDPNEEAFVDYVCAYMDSLTLEEAEAQEKWMREMHRKAMDGYKFTPEDWEKFWGMFGLGRDEYKN